MIEKWRNTVGRGIEASAIYKHEGVRINDSLWYHISKEYPGQVAIHLASTNIEPSLAGAKAFIEQYKTGLQELARRLQTEPELAEINAITGWSKIVYEYPKILEMLGFTVTERDEDKGEALAIMSREKFLERYGSINEQPDTRVSGQTNEQE